MPDRVQGPAGDYGLGHGHVTALVGYALAQRGKS